ncbi:hypothetical protein BU25DRAFT_453733 [Macroventuria anomochaeta]|uniref:Uncharacterized protein n=1 Tax=Macroventuria anomochaeta TaxID=301207 RepID=A0ACB6SEX3_9PLEO|nr:uncharacterized protein BU25DRAFT_453733 [Macroventuria anomochaeta]KAF2632518.1 hypothetical protein BU25DRAFT_453733 [Macroventuria anomochaeta]
MKSGLEEPGEGSNNGPATAYRRADDTQPQRQNPALSHRRIDFAVHIKDVYRRVQQDVAKEQLSQTYRLKHKHGHRQYKCEADGCESVFERQDARLKHYRRRHPQLTPDPVVLRKVLTLGGTGTDKDQDGLDVDRNLEVEPTVPLARFDIWDAEQPVSSDLVMEHHDHPENHVNISAWATGITQDGLDDDAQSNRQYRNWSANWSGYGSEHGSAASQVKSIFSEAFLISTATGLSAGSGYTLDQIAMATRELLPIFLENEGLVALYQNAVEHPDIGSERLARNVRRLLKTFARKLYSEANDQPEKVASRLVSIKASYIAQSVIEAFEAKTWQPQRLRTEEQDSSDEEDEGASARKQHRQSFWHRPRTTLVDLLAALGYLEPPLNPGWIRLRWHRRCGESFWSDVMEYREGGSNRAIERMEQATGTRVAVTFHNNGSTNQNWRFKIP